MYDKFWCLNLDDSRIIWLVYVKYMTCVLLDELMVKYPNLINSIINNGFN